MYDVGFGYMHYDDVVTHNAGWYALAGEPAVRLGQNQNGELANNVVWLTNLDYDIMAVSNLSSNVRFRRMDFLGEKVKQLIVRLGYIDPAGVQLCEVVEIFASIFERVMRYAEICAGVETVPMGSLKMGLRSLLRPKPDPILPSNRRTCFEEAEQYFSSVTRSAQPSVEWLPLYVPPYILCETIFAHYLPVVGSRWEQIDFSNSRNFLEDLVGDERCSGLVKAHIYGFTPEIERIINFGNTPTRNRGQRQWITLHEALFLQQLAHVDILDILITRDTDQVPLAGEILAKLDNQQKYSLSGMLFLNNLWGSLAQRLAQGYAHAGIRRNVAAPMVRFLDRQVCFHYASELLKSSLEVVGYGSGRVYINCTNTTSQEILKACRLNGLIPPKLNVREVDDVDDAEADAHTLLGIHQTLWGRGELQALLEYDQFCAEKLTS